MVRAFTHWWSAVIGFGMLLFVTRHVAAVDMGRASQLHAHSDREQPGVARRDAHSPTHEQVQDTHSVKSETLPMEQILRELPAADVARLLAAAGYTNVDLGVPVHAPPSTGKRFVERTTAKQCETVVMHGHSSMTERETRANVRLDDLDAMDGVAAGPAQVQGSVGSMGSVEHGTSATSAGSAPSPSQQASFVEEEVVESKSQSRADSSDSKTLKQLNCECETYKCSCRKDCYCSLNDEQFEGTQVVREASKNALPMSNADHQFKCSCAFEGVGGVGLITGGTMNCDCKVADCSCEKQCVCRSKDVPGRPYVSPRFHEVDSRTSASSTKAASAEAAADSAEVETFLQGGEAGNAGSTMDIFPG